jgi:hypothetical protein
VTLLAADRTGAESDQRVPDSPPSGASSAGDVDLALRGFVDAHVCGATRQTLRLAFERWTTAAGFDSENRDGVVVAHDPVGRVVAFFEVREPPTGASHRVLRDAAWAIVRDSAGMTATGHGAGVRWARALLGLEEPNVSTVSSDHRTGPHVHGWALVDGVWTCVQDYYAAGAAPGTGCDQTLDEADQT